MISFISFINQSTSDITSLNPKVCPHAARTWSALHSSGTTNSWWHRLLFLPWLSYSVAMVKWAMMQRYVPCGNTRTPCRSSWSHSRRIWAKGRRPCPTNPDLLVVSPKKQTTETTLGSKSGSKLSDDVKVIGSMPYRESNSYKSYVLRGHDPHKPHGDKLMKS